MRVHRWPGPPRSCDVRDLPSPERNASVIGMSPASGTTAGVAELGQASEMPSKGGEVQRGSWQRGRSGRDSSKVECHVRLTWRRERKRDQWRQRKQQAGARGNSKRDANVATSASCQPNLTQRNGSYGL